MPKRIRYDTGRWKPHKYQSWDDFRFVPEHLWLKYQTDNSQWCIMPASDANMIVLLRFLQHSNLHETLLRQYFYPKTKRMIIHGLWKPYSCGIDFIEYWICWYSPVDHLFTTWISSVWIGTIQGCNPNGSEKDPGHNWWILCLEMASRPNNYMTGISMSMNVALYISVEGSCISRTTYPRIPKARKTLLQVFAM